MKLLKFFSRSSLLKVITVLGFTLKFLYGQSADISATANNSKRTDTLFLKGKNYDVELEPESFSLLIKTKNGHEAYASKSQEKSTIAGLQVTDSSAQWQFQNKDIWVKIELKDDYLDVDIFSNIVNNFTWPIISEDVMAYTLPWAQGKYIPAGDSKWIKFWNYLGAISEAEGLSMQFMGVNYKDFALVFIIKNMFNNEITLNGTKRLNLQFAHEFPATDKEKKYGFQIYITKNDPVEIAKTYKKYMQAEGKFLTLEEKAGKNPNIRKLYGAPFIYLWGDQFLIKENIKNWNEFSKYFVSGVNSPIPNLSKHILDLIKDNETLEELNQILKELKETGSVNQYAQNSIISAINEALTSRNFYSKGFWNEIEFDSKTQDYIKKGVKNLTQVELYDFNKKLFYLTYKNYLESVSEWGNGTSSFVLNKLQEMGIKKAWLGLVSFQPAYMHPVFLKKSNDMGYLMGVYDSYHSIHEPGKEKWETAQFADTTLFYTSTIVNKDGTINKGYQGVGRKLNPMLSLPAVQTRVDDILNNGLRFNSWFIDCDAAGEVFDDYTKGRMTSQSQDVDGRLQRMAWIRDAKQMVIGSEGGNDYTATTIAFAHGLCSPLFVWNDLDWRKNKDSKYYFGPGYAPDGGVPLHFTKQVPIKPLYHYVYYDCRFNLPLFQLVYNNSVIPSHHWGLGSLRIADEVINNKLREILYNFPPLYNLDRKEIAKRQNTIASHVKVFAETHSKAVKQEMTDFEYLTDDKLVQKTSFGSILDIIANFGDIPYKKNTDLIPAKSLLIIDYGDNKKTIYTPIQ